MFCVIQVIVKVAQGLGETQEIVLNKIFDVWLDKMALVTQLERRKLLGLALASVLTAQSRYNFLLEYKYIIYATFMLTTVCQICSTP
jgi:hypothetical protein